MSTHYPEKQTVLETRTVSVPKGTR